MIITYIYIHIYTVIMTILYQISSLSYTIAQSTQWFLFPYLANSLEMSNHYSKSAELRVGIKYTALEVLGSNIISTIYLSFIKSTEDEWFNQDSISSLSAFIIR